MTEAQKEEMGVLRKQRDEACEQRDEAQSELEDLRDVIGEQETLTDAQHGYVQGLPAGWKCFVSADCCELTITNPSGREERIRLEDLPKRYVQARAAEREWREEAAETRPDALGAR